MALALPTCTKLTASAATIDAVLTASRTWIAASSADFSIVANGPADDAFTLSPDDAGENWYINIREKDATTAYISMDPLENVTAPGVAGSPGTPPTLTDSSEWSDETEGLFIDGTISTDFYLCTMYDVIYWIFMDSGKTFVKYIWMAGRVMRPFFDDGTVGDNYTDGLGWFAGVAEASTASATNDFLSNPSSGTNRIRRRQTTWGLPVAMMVPTTTQVADVGGQKRLAPAIIGHGNTDGSSDSMCGFTKYAMFAGKAELPGYVLDGGVGNDAWVHYKETASTDNLLLPWERGVTPDF